MIRLGDRRDVVTKWEVSWEDPSGGPMSCTGFDTSDAALGYIEALPAGCRRVEMTLVTRERFGVAG